MKIKYGSIRPLYMTTCAWDMQMAYWMSGYNTYILDWNYTYFTLYIVIYNEVCTMNCRSNIANPTIVPSSWER